MEERLQRRVLQVAAVLLVSLALALALPNRLNWRSDSPYLESLTGVANYKEGSGRGRLIQYGNTLSMAADHPILGVGPGNWPVYYPRYKSRADPSFDTDDIIPTNPWPSSDWMAMVSERGFWRRSLLVCWSERLLALGAWARVRGAGRRASAASSPSWPLIATVVVGAFDAVLVLPCPDPLRRGPSSAPWTSSARPIREVALDHAGPAERWRLGGAAGWRAAGPERRTGAAMASRAAASREALERPPRWIRGATGSRCSWRRSGRAPAAATAPFRSPSGRPRALSQPSCAAGRAAGLSGESGSSALVDKAAPWPYSTHQLVSYYMVSCH